MIIETWHVPNESGHGSEPLKLDVSQGVPVAERKWMEHLTVVRTGERTYVGLVKNGSLLQLPVTMYGALEFLSQYSVRPIADQPGKIDIKCFPQVILPIDSIGPYATLRIHQVDVAWRVQDQPETLRDTFSAQYLNQLDPSRVLRP